MDQNAEADQAHQDKFIGSSSNSTSVAAPAVDGNSEVRNSNLSSRDQQQKWLVRIPPEVCTLWDSLEGGETVGKLSFGNEGQIGLSLSVVRSTVPYQKEIAKYEDDDMADSLLTDKAAIKSSSSQELEEGEILSPLTPIFPPSPVPVPAIEEKKAEDDISGDVFHEYTLSEYGTSLQNNMMVMKTTDEDNCSVFGTVAKKFKAFPVRGKEYTDFMKKKTECIKRNRMPIKLKKPVLNSYMPVSNHPHNIEQEKKRKHERRYRMDREELSQKLFEVFESQKNYSFKSLIELTRQPSSFLKDVLLEYCNFNSSGSLRSTWELKPEYRHYDDKSKV